MESVRALDWKPDPQIKKQVDEKIKIGSPGLKAAITKAQNRAKDKKNKKEKPTFTPMSTTELPADEKARKEFFPVHIFMASTQLDYHLRDSFLADSAANTHITNQKERVYNLHPAALNDYVYARASILPIEDFGSINIFTDALEGKCIIIL